MNIKIRLAGIAAIMLGATSIAQATVYNISAVFTEPDAMYDTVFNGTLEWNGNTVTSMQGSMNSSMSVPENTPNLILNQHFLAEDSASLGNEPGMTTFSIFLLDSPYVYSNGVGDITGNHKTGTSLAYGNPGAGQMLSADGNTPNYNAYFSLTFDTALGPMSANLLDMVYGDCTPAGMMFAGNICMTGFGGVTYQVSGISKGDGSMSAYASSLMVTAVPIPATLWLFASALASMIGMNTKTRRIS